MFVAPVETANAIVPAVEAALNGELASYLRGRELAHGALEQRDHAMD